MGNPGLGEGAMADHLDGLSGDIVEDTVSYFFADP